LHRQASVCDDVGMQTPGSPLPAPSLEATHGFSAGAVLSRGFSVWTSNLPLFFGVSLVCYLPLLLIPTADPANPASGLLTIALTVVVQSVMGVIVSAAVIRGVFEELRGSRASFGDSVGVAFRSMWRILGTTLLAGLIVMLFSFLLLVPGIMKGCSYYVAIPAAVVEGTGPSESLSRSKKLTEGYRWHILGVLFVAGLIGAIIGGAAGVVFRSTTGPLQMLLVAVIPHAIAGSLGAVFYGVAYYQLRVAKEGIDIEQLASVFD